MPHGPPHNSCGDGPAESGTHKCTEAGTSGLWIPWHEMRLIFRDEADAPEGDREVRLRPGKMNKTYSSKASKLTGDEAQGKLHLYS